MNEEWQDIEIREKRNLKLEEKFEDEVDEDTALQPDDNLINVDTAEHTTGNDERGKKYNLAINSCARQNKLNR